MILDPRLQSKGLGLLSLVHLLAFILMATRLYGYGSCLSFVLLFWYWLRVKPLEPIAEPQSVGLLAPSLVLAWGMVGFLRGEKRGLAFSPKSSLTLLVLRLGVAYPFLEWGLDALRNPFIFYSYFRLNHVANWLVEPFGVELGTWLLGVFEVALAVFLTVGLMSKWSSLTAFSALVVFLLVAGYPLAFPQDLGLGACSLFLASSGPGWFSLDMQLPRLYTLSTAMWHKQKD